MNWAAGTTIQVESQTVGRPARVGHIMERIGSQGDSHYRVHWDDGRESIYYPGADGHVVSFPDANQTESSWVVPLPPHLGDRVGNLMSAPVRRADAKDTLRDVAKSLARSDIGVLIVLDGDQAIGVVSERDVIQSLAAGADPDEVWAADISSAEITWGSPDDSILEAADAMTKSGIRHLPLRQAGHLVGIVSSRDILSAVVGGRHRPRT